MSPAAQRTGVSAALLVAALVGVLPERAAAQELPYCASPATRVQHALCDSGDTRLQGRVARVESLSAALLDKPEQKGVAKRLTAFYKRLERVCLSKKPRDHAACLYREAEQEAVAVSRQVQAAYGLSDGPAAGRYALTGHPGVSGELIFLRLADGTASFYLDSFVDKADRQCAVNVAVMEADPKTPTGFAWSPFDQPECRMTFAGQPGAIELAATPECEAHFCGNGAVFTGRWAEKR